MPRHLDLLATNCFWASTIEKLNDPCEGYHKDGFSPFLNLFEKLSIGNAEQLNSVRSAFQELTQRRFKTGIFSLSSDPLNPQMWAHYAGSHNGFCVGYKPDLLVDNLTHDGRKIYHVRYSKKPATLGPGIVLRRNDQETVKRLLCTKSPPWGYEKEYRILVEQEGRISHHYDAIRTIYFGSKMTDDHRSLIMTTLAGRGIQFLDVLPHPSQYVLEARPINNPADEEITYLRQHVDALTGSKTAYEVTGCKKHSSFNKIEIDVQTSEEVNSATVVAISAELARCIYSTAKRHFVRFRLFGEPESTLPFALTAFEDGQLVSK